MSVAIRVVCSGLVFGCASSGGEGGTQEILDNLAAAGFPAPDIHVIGDKVYVGRDAEVSLEASREMLESVSDREQYRTANLVAGPDPAVICVSGAAFTDPTLSAGLDLAIENYNQQFIAGRSRLYFFRVAGGLIQGCTFLINGIIQPGLVGGVAGFPANGAPFGQITIGGGLINFGVDVTEHVITHELGHCIGFRHTDFFNRSISCGGLPVNEEVPPSGIGAIHIPGTPTGSVVGQSVLNSCFSAVETGEFTPSDVIAINALY
jgi:Dual-action HEIGH metallo-peptidase